MTAHDERWWRASRRRPITYLAVAAACGVAAWSVLFSTAALPPVTAHEGFGALEAARHQTASVSGGGEAADDSVGGRHPLGDGASATVYRCDWTRVYYAHTRALRVAERLDAQEVGLDTVYVFVDPSRSDRVATVMEHDEWVAGRTCASGEGVNGWIEDLDGRGLAGLRVLARPFPHDVVEGRELRFSAVTDSDGSFVIEDALPLDRTVSLWVVGDPYRPVRVGEVIGGTEVRIQTGLLSDAIGGRVVDAAGRPVGGAEVEFDELGTESRPRRVQTGSDGDFLVVDGLHRSSRYRVTANVYLLGDPVGHADQLASPGTLGLELRLATETAELRVRRRDGSVVERFAVLVAGGADPRAKIVASGFHPDGVCRFTGLTPSGVWARVMPLDSDVLRSDDMRIQPAETTTVVLDDAWQLDVTVVDSDFVPIAGAELEVVNGTVDSAWPRRHGSTPTRDLRHELGVEENEPRYVHRWTAAVTGDLGIASLVLPREVTGFYDRYVLRVDADGYVPRAMDIRGSRPGRDEWVVQLERAGTVVVEIEDPAVRIVGGFLLRRQEGPVFETTYPDTWERSDGAAPGELIVGLPRGTYTVWHVERGRFGLDQPLATVTLAAGASSTVRLSRSDVEEWIAQRLDITLVWTDDDPSDLEHVRWELRPVDYSKIHYKGQFAGMNVIQTPDLRPGRYRLVIDGMGANGQIEYVSREVLDTSTPQQVAHMEFGSLDWMVVDQEGRARADVVVNIYRLRPGNSVRATVVRTDVRGLAKDYYALTGSIKVSLGDGSAEVMLDESEYRGRGRVVTIPDRR